MGRVEREAGLADCKTVHLPPSDARLFTFLLPSFCPYWLNLIVGSCPVVPGARAEESLEASLPMVASQSPSRG